MRVQSRNASWVSPRPRGAHDERLPRMTHRGEVRGFRLPLSMWGRDQPFCPQSPKRQGRSRPHSSARDLSPVN